MKTFSLILLLSSSLVWARDYSTHNSLADLMEEIRDPVFNSSQRVMTLDHTRKIMADKLARELKVPKGELSLAFVKNPTRASLLLRDPWYDVQTQFYTTLHQEHFHQRWVALQKYVKFTDYGKSLYSTMMGHMGQYSPVIEGRYYVRWNKVSIKTGSSNRAFNVPYFLMSENINDLIKMEAHVPFEELLPDKDLSPSRPSLSSFVKRTPGFSRIQRQELAEKMELNHRIYIRAVANAAKTVGSLYYLTGSLNRSSTEIKIRNFLGEHCEGCSVSEKKEYQQAAMNYLDLMKSTMTVSSVDSVVSGFCRSLKKNQYYWNPDRLKPTPAEILLDQRKLINYYVVHKLKDKNKIALAKTILDQDMGILFLTNSMNILDRVQEPVGTKLICSTASRAQDKNLVTLAIREAESNVEAYVVRVNRQLLAGKFNLNATNATLDYFVQTNQAASIEATASYPQGIGWVLKSIALLDKDSKRRKTTDAIVNWGGLIVGAGLTLSGIGAPEGVVILVSTAQIIKGTAVGGYFLVRAKQEKAFLKDLHIAKAAGGVSSDANFKFHYSTFKSLKVQYIKEFGQSAFGFYRLHQVALNKASGDIPKAHSLLRRVFKTAKETGVEEGGEVFQEFFIDLIFNS